MPKANRLVAALLASLLAATAPGAIAKVPGRGRPAADAAAAPRLLQITTLESVSKSERAAIFAEYVGAWRAAVQARDNARAHDLAERAAGLFPDLCRPWLHLAAARLRLDQWGPAIEAARRAETARDDAYAPPIAADEARAAAGYWEGLALFRTQRYDEALVRLRAARRAAPTWAEAARALGEAAFVAGKLPESAAAYGAAFETDPQVGAAQDLSYYAEARATGGDLGGGIAALQEALRREPYAAGLHAKLGDLLRRDGDPTEAWYHLVLEPLVQGVQGPFSQPALAAAERIVQEVRADSTSPARHELLAISAGLRLMEAGKPHVALHSLDHALQMSRTATPVPRLLVADALLRDGKLQQAHEEIGRLLAHEPGFVPALYTRAEIERQLGREQDADRTLDEARRLYPEYWKLATRP